MMSTAPADTPTEKHCTKCGEVKAVEEFSRDRRRRDGRRARCRVCDRAYYVANRDKIAERKAAYCVANRDKIRERKAAYRVANRDKTREQDAAYRVANRDKIRERKAAYHVANRARTDEQVAADAARLRPDGLKRCGDCERMLPLGEFRARRREPDGRQQICRACKAARAAAHRARDIADTVARSLDLDGGRCYLCGCDLDPDGTVWHVEHVLPRSRADEWPWADVEHVDNTRLACEACNLAKAARTPHEHFARLAALGDEAAAATLKAAAEIRAHNATV